LRILDYDNDNDNDKDDERYDNDIAGVVAWR